ncbi:hypothetical protein GH714_038340 [Hevea brasiliensis]|uniref:DUF1664 domain-containing protein n=1 Tax=Hevea brasiliensis TaxID=3981 RepID=A0A6A6LGH6_HEVBR|nr:hypothetical protein GH714_038340 [Hevea brasiliensis]
MAMQTGIGLSRIIVLAGAGFTGTVLFKNGKLSDLIGELQSLVKGLEKSGESADGDSHYSDAIAQQVKRLAMEVRQLASARQITVLNGSSGQMGNLTGLIVPATALGALGYGYMWWKVNAASENISQIGSELWQLQCLVSGLDGKIGSLEEKQDQLKPSGRARSSLTYPEVPSLTGLKELADNLSRTISEPTGVIMQDGIDKLEDPSRTATM